MLEPIQIREVEARPLAVVRGQATLAELPTRIVALLDLVWPFVREQGLLGNDDEVGHNTVVYLDGVMNIEVGVSVRRPFPDGETVKCSATPAGRAAMVSHWGPYKELPETYKQLQRWCQEQGLRRAGPSWEVYGHWSDDPAQLRTDLYMLLEPDPQGTAATGL